MFTTSKFHDRSFTAFTVPPSAHDKLDDDFKELSRIHFYLGRHPIDFMIKAVEKASLEDIERGKIQLYFASLEIQDFLSKSWTNLDTFSKNSLDPSLYFQKSFDDILKETLHVLNKVYSKPNAKNNLDAIETMIGLTHEIIILNTELSKIGIDTKIESVEEVKTLYKKILPLKSNYENLSLLKNFDDYSISAKQSLINQLKQPYQFNYSEMVKRVYGKTSNWVYHLHDLAAQRSKIDEDGHVFNYTESKKLKENFLTQIKSFNSLMKNGIVNYVHSFSAAISTEIYKTVSKSLVSADNYYSRQMDYYEKSLKNGRDKEYYQNKIKELKESKNDFIKTKNDDKIFYEQYLTLLNRQESNIEQAFEQIKLNLLNYKLKESIFFEGDITKGFVIGKFSNVEKVILIHKDKFVSEKEAIYAIVMDKSDYNLLVENNELIFTEEIREKYFSSSCNFFSYGQFLQEIKDPIVQKHLLGQEFTLLDNTVINLKNDKNKPK